MANNPPQDDNAQNQLDYGSNIRLTDDPLPDDTEEIISDTHPKTDSDIDSHEAYDEGLSSAAEATKD